MKKIVFSVLIVMISVFSTQAQEVAIKAGVTYSNASSVINESFGYMFGATFIEGNLELTGDFNYYMDNQGDQLYTPYAFNLDGRYILLNKGKFQMYPMLGINLSNFHGIEMGLNVGAGSRYTVSPKLSVFSDLKYTFGSMDGTSINLGIQLRP